MGSPFVADGDQGFGWKQPVRPGAGLGSHRARDSDKQCGNREHAPYHTR